MSARGGTGRVKAYSFMDQRGFHPLEEACAQCNRRRSEHHSEGMASGCDFSGSGKKHSR